MFCCYMVGATYVSMLELLRLMRVSVFAERSGVPSASVNLGFGPMRSNSRNQSCAPSSFVASALHPRLLWVSLSWVKSGHMNW